MFLNLYLLISWLKKKSQYLKLLLAEAALLLHCQKRFLGNEKADKKNARNGALICDKKVWCPKAKWYQGCYRSVYVSDAFPE